MESKTDKKTDKNTDKNIDKKIDINTDKEIKKTAGKKSVMKTFILGQLALATALTIVLGTATAFMYGGYRIVHLEDEAFDYCKTIAGLIDGDSIEGYITTGIRDDYYYMVQDVLNTFQKNADAAYFYVILPKEEDYIYVWDADIHEHAMPFGFHEQYTRDGREAMEKVASGDSHKAVLFYNVEPYGYMVAVYTPIYDSEGEIAAVMGVDIGMPEIVTEIGQFILSLILSIALTVSGSVILYVHKMKKHLVEPVLKLKSSAEQLVDDLESENEIKIDIHTGDEFDDLARSFEFMRAEVKDYLTRLTNVTAERERIGAELDVATAIQSSMLPSIFPAFPDIPAIDVYASMDPAKEVGGDFYDFFMVDDTHVAFVVADVSGKGVPAALFMVIAKTLIKDHTAPGKEPAEVFHEVNNILCESNSEMMFVTAFEGILDIVTGELLFCNAGHELPFICGRDGVFRVYNTENCFVLAGMENMNYKTGRIMLEPGDRFFQYSDGVPEATDSDYKLFDMDRLEESLNRYSDRDLPGIISGIREDIDDFVGAADQFDDITMLCFEFRGNNL